MKLNDWLETHFSKLTIVEVPWFWWPYHETGLSALDWARRHSKSKTEVINLSDKLSVPWGIQALNPAPRILHTLTESGHPQFFSISVSEAQKILRNWEPVFVGKSSGHWSLYSDDVGIPAWEKLLLLERLDGLTNSHTTLKFQRIDEETKF